MSEGNRFDYGKYQIKWFETNYAFAAVENQILKNTGLIEDRLKRIIDLRFLLLTIQ
ncbi:hypothetical protein IEE83_28460 [Dyadobacter sp. UP-52]|uniref:Uncharacterized protein n=1 Tax=Dyadobacter subterraneus TaxID=2773304 RepID=A0ABR9WKB8_9BACT|nr:hypothetical protein [Dyadobacter subterraneus]